MADTDNTTSESGSSAAADILRDTTAIESSSDILRNVSVKATVGADVVRDTMATGASSDILRAVSARNVTEADIVRDTATDVCFSDILRNVSAKFFTKSDLDRRSIKADDPQADIVRVTTDGYFTSVGFDIARFAAMRASSVDDIVLNDVVNDIVDASIKRDTLNSEDDAFEIARYTSGLIETNADIFRKANYIDSEVHVKSDLSKTINETIPTLATTNYVNREIKKFIADSEELQTVLMKLRESIGADDVDRVLTALSRYLPLDGGTITGDLEVRGALHGTADKALVAITTGSAELATNAKKADYATVAKTAQDCQGNALTADTAAYANRAAVAESCSGNAATATVADTAKSVQSVQWNSIQDVPKSFQAKGGTADYAVTAQSVDWSGVKNHPKFITEVKWDDIQGIPAAAVSDSVAWEKVIGRPSALPADGGTADVAKSVDWENIRNKPGEKIVNWKDVGEKPELFLKADGIDWNNDIVNKPKYFPAKTITWERVSGKPDTFPHAPVDYNTLLNLPEAFPTTWEQVSGKPADLVHASDKIAEAAYADEASVAFNIPTKDVGGNIWIQE